MMLSVVSMKEVCHGAGYTPCPPDASRYTSSVHVPNRWEGGNVWQSPFSLLKMLSYAVQVATVVTGLPRVALLCHRP